MLYETDVQAEIMLEATRLGHRLMRNNVGVAKHKPRDGGDTMYVAYGVGGTGGSDLIGFTRRRIYTPELPGDPDRSLRFVDVPWATYVECKRPRGKKGDDQIKFINGMKAHGCIAGFCYSVEDYRKLVGAICHG